MRRAEKDRVSHDIRNTYDYKMLVSEYKTLKPICSDPFGFHHITGKYNPTEHVHHIYEIQNFPERARDPRNLLNLCRLCHSTLHLENWTRKVLVRYNYIKGTSVAYDVFARKLSSETFRAHLMSLASADHHKQLVIMSGLLDSMTFNPCNPIGFITGGVEISNPAKNNIRARKVGKKMHGVFWNRVFTIKDGRLFNGKN